MDNSRLLYDAFNIYYEKGMEALKEGNFDVARRNILLASETLLKLAKESNSPLKEKRIKRAEELELLVDKIDNKQIEVSNNTKKQNYDNESSIDVQYNEEISLDEALNNLMKLEGLSEVKQQVSDLVDQIKVFQLRGDKGLAQPEMSHHMVFTGNPGTGKTTVARIIGQIYHALGILSKGHMVEVDRGDLVAGYVGQTALKTKDVINKAMGGVLFIDEAYTLKKEDGNDFGQEAIDTLNKSMEDFRNDFVVIVAGYANEMQPFIDSNQGLKSRFRTYVDFKDYSGEELYNIFLGLLKDNEYKLDTEAEKNVFEFLTDKEKNQFSGNARDVRNLFENIVKLQSRRVALIDNPKKLDLVLITKRDLPFMIKNKCDIKKNINTNSCLVKRDDCLEMNLINNSQDSNFDWDSLPDVKFDDIAGLEYAKQVVKDKVLMPLQYPEAFDGYLKKNGGGLFLYGPPGTGKTMLAAAIANEIGAKFCSVKPSDLIKQGLGNTEKTIKALFTQARQYPCSIIYFDEIDSIAQKNTRSSFSKQLRSELLSQIQGVENYNKDSGNILFLIASTNKPWDVDSAFIRPGRFGTKVYVGLPEEETRLYMIENRFNKMKGKGLVSVLEDVSIDDIVNRTYGFNGADITNLLDRIDEISALRSITTGEKIIKREDVEEAFKEINSSVQTEDIEKLMNWKELNNG